MSLIPDIPTVTAMPAVIPDHTSLVNSSMFSESLAAVHEAATALRGLASSISDLGNKIAAAIADGEAQLVAGFNQQLAVVQAQMTAQAAELNDSISRQVGALNAQGTAISQQVSNLVPANALMTLPAANPADIVTYLGHLKDFLIAPQVATATAYISQATALSGAAASFGSSVSSAVGGIPGVSITVPSISIPIPHFP